MILLVFDGNLGRLFIDVYRCNGITDMRIPTLAH